MSLCRHKKVFPNEVTNQSCMKKSQTQSFHKILVECIEEFKMISALVTNSHSQFIKILDFISHDYSSADEQEPQRSKRSVFGSVFKWLFGGLGGTDKNV